MMKICRCGDGINFRHNNTKERYCMNFTIEKTKKAENVVTAEELLREFATLTNDEQRQVLEYAKMLTSGNAIMKGGEICG